MYTRYLQGSGKGLLYNPGLDFDRLDDDEMAEYEELMVALEQPPRGNNWGASIVFAFSDESRWERLISLATKMSKTGVKRVELDPRKYDILWESDDGQVGLRKKISKR